MQESTQYEDRMADKIQTVKESVVIGRETITVEGKEVEVSRDAIIDAVMAANKDNPAFTELFQNELQVRESLSEVYRDTINELYDRGVTELTQVVNALSQSDDNKAELLDAYRKAMAKRPTTLLSRGEVKTPEDKLKARMVMAIQVNAVLHARRIHKDLKEHYGMEDAQDCVQDRAFQSQGMEGFRRDMMPKFKAGQEKYSEDSSKIQYARDFLTHNVGGHFVRLFDNLNNQLRTEQKEDNQVYPVIMAQVQIDQYQQRVAEVRKVSEVSVSDAHQSVVQQAEWAARKAAEISAMSSKREQRRNTAQFFKADEVQKQVDATKEQAVDKKEAQDPAKKVDPAPQSDASKKRKRISIKENPVVKRFRKIAHRLGDRIRPEKERSEKQDSAPRPGRGSRDE